MLYDESIAAGIAVENSAGAIRCVLDVTNGHALWKFPVGRARDGESPEMCAVRELQEETGIIVDPKLLVLMKKEWRSDHWRFIYWTNRYDDSAIRSLGIEGGEKVLEGKWIPNTEIVHERNFIHEHAQILREFLLRSACA